MQELICIKCSKVAGFITPLFKQIALGACHREKKTICFVLWRRNLNLTAIINTVCDVFTEGRRALQFQSWLR